MANDVSGEDIEELYRGAERPERKLRRELGRDATRLGDTKFRLDMLRDLHGRGVRLAAVYCLIVCRDRHATVPRWALAALADGFERYLHSTTREKLEHALFGRRTGRLADPRLEVEHDSMRSARYRAVKTAKAEGLRGEKALDRAEELLRKIASTCSQETIRRAYFEYKKRYSGPPSPRLLYARSLLEGAAQPILQRKQK